MATPRWRWAVPLALAACAGAQFQFEIPAEMLQGFMGGMGGGQRVQPTEWPKTENSEVAAEFDWLVNTEWKGKTAKYLLLRDGFVESPLKECEPEGQCLWAANNGRVLINTPTLKVIRFTITGLEQTDRKKLENKDEGELAKIQLISEKPGKSGKRSVLDFSRVATSDSSENMIARDLYEVLEVAEDADQSSIKSKFRRLSVQNHPDKGGNPQTFNEIREAYEVLSDPDSRKYYDMGGMQLVKNVETAWKEVEGQKSQLDAQLAKVPKNHPQYPQFKAQIEAQKQQFEKTHMKHEIEKKLRNDDVEVLVPISAEELYTGVARKPYQFRRLVICRGCRADPDRPQCRDCGRCPPEKVQVPKYGMTPFGRQVVGMREKEQETREKCREVSVAMPDLRVAKGAKEGTVLKYVSDVGHQTPGKIPGRVVLKVQRGSANDTHTIAEADLHTVLHVPLEKALFGFTYSWTHLGDEKLTIVLDRVSYPGQVIRIPRKGLVGDGSTRGDLYVRLAVDLPQVAKGTRSLTLEASGGSEFWFEREDSVQLNEGSAWLRWSAREAASVVKASKNGKQEL